MSKLVVSAEQAEKIAAKLPAGRTLSDIRLIRCSATIEEVDATALDAAERLALANDVETAGGPPLITDGKPTIMRVVAWMAHEGVNKNRDEFLADDLGPAADAIRIPNVLPMDWNHSAFRPWSDAPKAIGLWYSAEKRWDPNAKAGKGAYGILVRGIVWSWLFPDYANQMLAEQARAGKLEFSMACLPTSVTYTSDDDGPKAILHQPTFLTNAALDVPPADVDATGIGVEGSNDPALESTLSTTLTSSTAAQTAAPLPRAAAMTPIAQSQEEPMDELQEQIDALTAQVATLTETQNQLESTRAELATASARIAELEGELTEVTTAKDALVTELATANDAITATRTELDAAQARLTEIDAAASAAAAAERYAQRIAALPESYREALDKRTAEERTRFETKWTAASEEDWSEFASEIAVAFAHARPDYVARTATEGGALPTPSVGTDGIAGLVSEIRK